MWLNSYNFWLIVSLVIFIMYLFTGGLSYINCLDAIKGYFLVFKEKGRTSYKNLLFFIFFPFTLSIATNLYTPLNKDGLNAICVIVSIMTAMLFSLMTIIDTKHTKIIEAPNKDCDTKDITNYMDFKMYNTTYKETVNIVVCEVLLSVFLLLLCFVQPMLDNSKHMKINPLDFSITMQSFANWLIFYLFYSFIVNLLIVVKRFYRFSEK